MTMYNDKIDRSNSNLSPKQIVINDLAVYLMTLSHEDISEILTLLSESALKEVTEAINKL